MNTLKIKLLIISLMVVNILFANKFQKGTIVLENDEIREGYVIIPKSCSEKNIFFKPDMNSNEEKIPSIQIKAISAQSIDGKIYDFERQYTGYKPGKKSKQKEWLFVCLKGYVNLYISSLIYESDKNGDVHVVDSYVATRDLPTFNYYLKKKNEEVALLFAITSPSPTMFGLNSMLRKNAAIYLSDHPDLVKRIENKEFTHKDIAKIIEIYNSYMMNK